MSRSQPLSSRAMLLLAILFCTCDASRSEIKHGVVLAAYAAPLTMHTHTEELGGRVAHAYSPRIQGIKAGRSQIQG